MNNLPYLVNVPPFIIRDLKHEDLTFIKKIYLIFFGKFIGFIVRRTKEKTFCFLINIFFKKNGKIIYEDKKYIKEINKERVAYYPNKRILRIVKSLDYQLNLLFDSYCLQKINFKDEDVVIDCGANVGELGLSFKNKGLNLNYIAFEPDRKTYDCLVLNIKNEKNKTYNLGLSNQNSKKEFFLDNDGGNSSLVDFGSVKSVEIETITLDSLELSNQIKLFKVEAEGYEPEVLKGSKNTLSLIEYVSVDFGPERGREFENTVVEVNNLLIESNFELIEFSNHRMIGLYKNKEL